MQTPDVTPALSVTSPPKTPPPQQKPEKKEPVFVDPWEGAGHPLEFEANPHLGHRPASPDVRIVRDDVCDVIVTREDEEVADAGVQADTSESSLDTMTESQTDQVISQGELVISHGEIKPKEIPHLNKLMPYHDDEVSSNQNEEMSEERSEGEIDPRNLRRKVPGKWPPQFPSVYARPRRPLPTSESVDDEISVGEVVARKPRGSSGSRRRADARKERFEKWKEQRRVSQDETDEDALAHVSVGEYLADDVVIDNTQDDVIDVSDDVVDDTGVINVVPADASDFDDVVDTIRVGDVIQVEEMGTGYGVAMESTLQTTGNSQIPIDSLDEVAGNKVAAENFPSVILEDSEQDF